MGLINKYYDLALVEDKIAANHYDKLSVKADACIACGHCDERCPFKVTQSVRMKEIAGFLKIRNRVDPEVRFKYRCLKLKTQNPAKSKRGFCFISIYVMIC